MRKLLLPVAALGAVLVTACGGAKPAAIQAPAPTPTPTQTPTPSPTPTAVYPLTGLPVTDAADARRPALSVKIDNISLAMPQAGLNDADLVADILVEGGLTRLMATYQSHDAPLIGPIRSARPVDGNLLRELGGGIFAFSGASEHGIAPVKALSASKLVAYDYEPQWFWRDHSRPAPHNVFSTSKRLYDAGRAAQVKWKAPAPLFTYSTTAQVGRSVSSVRLPFSSFSTAAWTWTGHGYARTQDGRPDVMVHGARVTTTNVVILSVGWHSAGYRDVAGNRAPYVDVIGSGKAWVMRDGTLVAGKWVRSSTRSAVKLVDAHGQAIPLSPGRTWLELQPRPFAPSFS